MSRNLGTLTLDLIAKIGGFTGPMDKAARNTKKNSKSMTDDLKKIGTAAGVMAVGAAAGFAVMINGSIKAADEMIKLSRAVGVPVETLSGLKRSADLSGVSLSDLGKGIKTFGKNTSEAFLDGVGTGVDAFSALQISITAVDGSLKNTDVLIGEVADRFSLMEDGAVKTALAQDLFGKSGANMINMLNGGSKALRENAEEAKRMGLIIGKDAAESAERFNDNLNRLKSSIAGVGTQVAMDLVEPMADLTDLFADPDFQQNIASTASGIVSFAKGAAEALSTVAGLTKFLSESAASAISGPNSDDLVRRDQEIEKLMARYVELDKFLKSSDLEKGFKVAGSPGLLLEDRSIEGLKKLGVEIEAKRQALREMYNTIGAGNVKVSETAVVAEGGISKLTAAQILQAKTSGEITDAEKKLNDEYGKTIASLEREIFLFGQSGRVAVAAYDLEHGALSKLDPKLKKNILDHEKQLETLENVGDALDGLIKNSGLFSVAAEKDSKEVESVYTGMFERITGASAGMIRGILDGTGNLADSVKDLLLTTISEIAADALINPIVLNIQSSITGDKSGGSGGAGGAGGLLAGAGPWGAVAAVAAVAVVAGVSEWNNKQNEKFEKMTSAYRQGTQSTGTLLGAANEKSQSINNALDAMSSQYDDVLSVNYGMYRALVDIRAGIVGVAAGFARTVQLGGLGDYSQFDLGKTAVIGDGLIESKNINSLIYNAIGGSNVADFLYDFHDGIFKKINKELFNTKTNVIDSGIQFLGGQLADLLAGGVVDAVSYADITSEKKLFGVSLGKKLNSQTAALDDVFLTQISSVFASAGGALGEASAAFDIDFQSYVDQLIIDPQKLSLKDLDPEALTAEIEAFFSSTLDNWAGVLLTGTDVLLKYQEAGEGAFETMLRVATETNYLRDILDATGVSVNATGLEFVDITQTLIDLSGGIDSLQGSLSVYYDKYFTDAEKFARLTDSLTTATAGLVDVLPQSHEAMRELVGGLDLTTDSGLATYAALIALAGPIDQYIVGLERNAEAAKKLTDFMAGFNEKLATNGMDDFARGIYDLNKNLAEALATAAELGATESDLATIRQASALDLLGLEAGRTDALLAGDVRAAFDASADELAKNYDAVVADLTRDFDARVTSLDGWLETQLSHFERRSKVHSDSISALTGLSGALGSAVQALRIDSEQLREQRYFAATAELDGLASSVAGGGALPTADAIQALAGSLNNGFEFFSTTEEYALANGLALNDVSALAGSSDKKLSVEEKTLDAIERGEQTARDNHTRMLAQLQADSDRALQNAETNYQAQLEKQEAQYQQLVDQVNILRGISTSVPLVGDAVEMMRRQIADELMAMRKADQQKYEEMVTALNAIANFTSESASIARYQQLEELENSEAA